MSKKSTRQAYGEALVELGQINKNIVVLDADLSKSTKTDLFKKALIKVDFPELNSPVTTIFRSLQR